MLPLSAELAGQCRLVLLEPHTTLSGGLEVRGAGGGERLMGRGGKESRRAGPEEGQCRLVLLEPHTTISEPQHAPVSGSGC